MLKVLLLCSTLWAVPAKQTSHVHGQGKVSIAFDGLRGHIQMELPGESLFGFEHEAKSKKDKAAKEAALKKLEEKIGEMIVFSPASECEIKKDIFEVNQEKSHSDLEAEFNVICQKAIADTSVTFNFQKFFARLKKVQVDVLLEAVQKTLQVTKDGESLELK